MIKVGTDFSGIGSPEQALKNLKIPHEVEFACDIDKYARQSYLANHSCKVMYEDITKRDHKEVEQLDLYIAGFPCQAFSMAGKRKGFEDVRGTLFFNVAEFIKINQPKSFILENVKGLLSHDKGRTFQTITDLLSNGGGTINGQMSLDIFEDGLGYHIYYQVLNTKEHGIPQNRERIFIVGFKQYRDYRFPLPQKLTTNLKDLLEENVSKKYYLSSKLINSFNNHKDRHQEKGNGFKFNPTDGNKIASCLDTKEGSRATNNFIKIPSATKCGYEKAKPGDSVRVSHIGSKTGRGRVGTNQSQTLTVGGDMHMECFRLQGFPDDFKKVVSDTQLYKQAGNSITVNVIQKVISNIYNR